MENVSKVVERVGQQILEMPEHSKIKRGRKIFTHFHEIPSASPTDELSESFLQITQAFSSSVKNLESPGRSTITQ